MSVKATNDNFASLVLESKIPVLVDFWAEWCGPCRMIGPIVEELASDVGDKALICKVNVDENSELAEKYQVVSIPTVIIFKNGQPAGKSIGVKSKAELLALLGV